MYRYSYLQFSYMAKIDYFQQKDFDELNIFAV